MRPGLLAAWQHEDGGRSWQFALRAGATFHDGKPCTAEDVAETIRAHLRGVDMFGMPWAYSRYLAGARITPEGPGMIIDLHPAPAWRPAGNPGGILRHEGRVGRLDDARHRPLARAGRRQPRSHAVLEAIDPALPGALRLIAEPIPTGATGCSPKGRPMPRPTSNA